MTAPQVNDNNGLNSATTLKRNLSFWQRLAFGLGCTSRYGMKSVRDVYSTIFLLEIARLPPGHVSLLSLFSKGLETVFDLLAGIALTQQKVSRYGKYKPWIAASSPIVCVFFVMLWFVPGQLSTDVKLVYYVFSYSAFYVGIACFNIPYLSLTVAASNSHEEFHSLASLRLVFQNLGIMLGPTLIAVVMHYEVPLSIECGSVRSLTLSVNDVQDYFSRLNNVYLYTAIALGLLHVLLSLTVSFFVPESSNASSFSTRPSAAVIETPTPETPHTTTPPADIAEANPPTLKQYKDMLFYKPFVCFGLLMFCVVTGYTVLMTNYSLYYRTVLDQYNIFPLITLIIYFSAALFVPLCSFLSHKLGNRQLLTITLILFMFFLWLHIYIKFSPALFYALAAILGLLFGFAQLIPQIMIKDIMGAFIEKYGDGFESVIYVVTECLSKIGEGFCVILSTAVLEFVGYQTGACEQPHSVAIALRLILGGMPLLFFMVAIIICWESPVAKEVSPAGQLMADGLTGKEGKSSILYPRLSQLSVSSMKNDLLETSNFFAAKENYSSASESREPTNAPTS